MSIESRISERFVNIGDFEIYCKILNPSEILTKPVIIFLHEGLGTSESWGFYAYELSQMLELPALIYDRRGYGKSSKHFWVGNSNYLHEEANLLNDLIKELGIRSPIIFGHSDGATIALIFGGLFPNKPSAVISVAAHTFLEDHTFNGVKKTIKLYDNLKFKEKLMKRLGDRTDDIFYSWALTWSSDGLVEWNIYDELNKIICPVLVLQGDNDQYGTLKQVLSISERNLKNSEYEILSDCGHIPHIEKKKEMLEKCANFVKNKVLLK